MLEVRNLTTVFTTGSAVVRAVDDVSFTVRPGQIVGVVGESGSGKSTLGRSLMRLVPRPGHITAGEIYLGDRDLLRLPEHEIRQARGREIAMIFQNPARSLHPAFTVGWQLREARRTHEPHIGRNDANEAAIAMLTRVGVPAAARRIDDYPHQFSGGMQQRVMIAMSLINSPAVLIADEPTAALDVTIQAQILALLRELAADGGMAVVLITHNFGVVANLCERVIVMYAGQAVETGSADPVFSEPLHPYTRGLLDSLPERTEQHRLRAIPGGAPTEGDLGQGCRFRRRCVHAEDICQQSPALVEIKSGRLARCWVTQREGGLPVPDNDPEGSPKGGAAPAPSPGSAEGDGQVIVELVSVGVHFSRTKFISSQRSILRAVDDITLEVRAGETLGIVGETGSGKSTLGRAILGLAPVTTGQVRIDGKPLPRHSRPGAAAKSLGLQMVFQDPAGSLNPRRSVEQSIGEGICNNQVTAAGLHRRVGELLDDVALPRALASRYPHELSGGQQQRVAIARALGSQPRLIVLDEAVSALDTSTQAQVLNLLLDLQERYGLTYIFISHDIEVVRFMSTRIAVMYLGKVVEIGAASAVEAGALHPYSICLASAVPYPDPQFERLRVQHVLSGAMPSPLAVPSGCSFHSRCPVAQFPICKEQVPQLIEHKPGIHAACHFAGRFDELLAARREESPTLIRGSD